MPTLLVSTQLSCPFVPLKSPPNWVDAKMLLLSCLKLSFAGESINLIGASQDDLCRMIYVQCTLSPPSSSVAHKWEEEEEVEGGRGGKWSRQVGEEEVGRKYMDGRRIMLQPIRRHLGR